MYVLQRDKCGVYRKTLKGTQLVDCYSSVHENVDKQNGMIPQLLGWLEYVDSVRFLYVFTYIRENSRGLYVCKAKNENKKIF